MKNCKFYATDKRTGKNITFTLNDLYGYEGEVCGVFIEPTGTALSYNSGCGFDGMNKDLEITDIQVFDE